MFKSVINTDDTLKYLVLKEDGKNASAFYGTYALCANDFARNYGGYPRSDIALINDQQNIQVAQAMLDKLPNIHVNGSLDDVSAKAALTSKYMQCPSEIIPYIERVASERLEKAERIRQAKEDAAASEKKAVDVIIENV